MDLAVDICDSLILLSLQAALNCSTVSCTTQIALHAHVSCDLQPPQSLDEPSMPRALLTVLRQTQVTPLDTHWRYSTPPLARSEFF